MKRKIDKLIVLAALSLLGYYLGLSIFRAPVHRLLLNVLPPMNTRHLPMYYSGIFSIVIVASLGYLLYTGLLERHSFKDCKTQYIGGVISLLFLPIIVLGIFRIHAIGIVKSAEATPPTGIIIAIHEADASFRITETSGIIYGKSIELLEDTEILIDIGNAIQELKIDEVVNRNKSGDATMWLTYASQKNKWYSKIINYDEGKFLESTQNANTVRYEGNLLAEIIDDQILEVGELDNFHQGRLIHMDWVEGGGKDEYNLSDEDYQLLISLMMDNKLITPEASIVALFNHLLTNGITPQDNHIYVIQLLSDQSDGRRLQNFIIYDDKLKVLRFEGEFYSSDLEKIIEKYN
ncbi:hypothetical protein [Alkaliphilus peptidifermentans]|uniref:Uncharacterized protein n=1 Tax=Alkaliphilus peptidifermentans DSM 18978 TaxID=1120976 RepID=A0A1G5JRA6_9FIRM|nr:hypothetical protein [Alkaliphilus peptidifermentans]SCY90654.1 hypothetical protein SAMN03080606_02979 [Alkaliphilus peptidifermentans DSM 18978]